MTEYYVSGMFVYSEVVEADSFEEAADIFADCNQLCSVADLDGEIAVTNIETDESRWL